MNKWETNLDEVIAYIKRCTVDEPYEADGNTLKPEANGWSWVRNSQCKYISLRIDMRDGAFVILNREGNRIPFEQLKYQYKVGDEEV